MPRLAFAPPQTAPRADILLVIFLRGAADALNMVVPHGEETYYALRPTLGIPRPDQLSIPTGERAIDLDGFFGFHPSLSALLPAWQSGHLACVHACGAPDESRSHFKAMELMERGVEDERGPASGWIGRYLTSQDTANLSPLRAIGFGSLPQRSLRGAGPVSAMQSIVDFHLGGDEQAATHMQAALTSLYQGSQPLDYLGRETLDILNELQRIDPESYHPAVGVRYPESEFGSSLRQIAMLVKAESGLEVAAIDLGGWDTHFAQGASSGLMSGLIKNLGDGLAALHADLIDQINSLSVVVMTEFGRRARENGSLGTDHGHGSLMLLLGGNVRGGKIHSAWPGLSVGQLVGPGDLAVTIDYRDILGELCLKRLNSSSLEEIFPGYPVRIRDVFL